MGPMKINPMPSQVLINVEVFTDSEGQYEPANTKREPVASVDAANAITSRTKASLMAPAGVHKAVLDIDFPATLIPSSTPGHYHLYIDKEMSWEAYTGLLRAMFFAGLLQEGYVTTSIERGYSAVRLPWIKKDGTQSLVPSEPVRKPVEDLRKELAEKPKTFTELLMAGKKPEEDPY
jgi:hypothetical protein